MSLESFYIEKTNTISVKLAILVLIGQLVSTVVVVGMYQVKMKLNQEIATAAGAGHMWRKIILVT